MQECTVATRSEIEGKLTDPACRLTIASGGRVLLPRPTYASLVAGALGQIRQKNLPQFGQSVRPRKGACECPLSVRSPDPVAQQLMTGVRPSRRARPRRGGCS
jgi:hypothetical protein